MIKLIEGLNKQFVSIIYILFVSLLFSLSEEYEKLTIVFFYFNFFY